MRIAIRTSVIFSIYLGIAVYSFGQNEISGNCIDAVTKKGIPHVNITFQKVGVVTDADENGYFEMRCIANDTIVFTCIGYEDVKLPVVCSQKIGTIEMNAKIVVLPEVFVGKEKHLTVGSTTEKNKFDMISTVCSRYEIATKINIPENIPRYRIDKININAFGFNSNNPVRIHIYEIGKYGEPGKDILINDIILNSDISVRKNVSIDIKEQCILLNAKAFFISIQWIADSINENLINKKKNKIIGPRVYCTYSNKNTITYTRSKSNNIVGYKWTLVDGNILYPYDLKQLPRIISNPFNMLVSCDISYF